MPCCKNVPSVSCCKGPNMQNRNKTLCKYPAASLILTATCFDVTEYPVLSLLGFFFAAKCTLKTNFTPLLKKLPTHEIDTFYIKQQVSGVVLVREKTVRVLDQIGVNTFSQGLSGIICGLKKL